MSKHPRPQYSAANVSINRLAFVCASWHDDMVNNAVGAAQKKLKSLGYDAAKIVIRVDVPGSLEIPLMCQTLAQTGKFDAIIAFGFVVNGGIYRHEFVAQAVIDGLMHAQLSTGVPVFSSVLTPINFHEHDVHSNFFQEHMLKKGEEVANACVTTLAAYASVARKLGASRLPALSGSAK